MSLSLDPILARLPLPEVLERTVRVPGKVSTGDAATVRLRPGLLDLLYTPRTPGGPPIGRGTHPMTGLPLGIAVDAAIVAASGKQNGIDVLRAASASWESPIRAGDVILATGEVIGLARRSVRVRITASAEADRRLLMQGEAVLVRVVDDAAADLTDLLATPPRD